MRWRVGRKLGRTLYRDDVCVGMVDSTELAATIVKAMNAKATARARMEALGMKEPNEELQRENLRENLGTIETPKGDSADEPHIKHSCALCGLTWQSATRPRSAVTEPAGEVPVANRTAGPVTVMIAARYCLKCGGFGGNKNCEYRLGHEGKRYAERAARQYIATWGAPGTSLAAAVYPDLLAFAKDILAWTAEGPLNLSADDREKLRGMIEQAEKHVVLGDGAPP